LSKKRRVVADICQPQKPKAVLRAQWTLGLWTAWLCLFGLYRSWRSLPGIQDMMTEQLHGAVSVAPETMLEITLVGYALLALTLAWLIFKIGQGKKWARTGLFVSFASQFLWTAIPPYHGIVDYLADAPDLGLQFFALCMLYTWPGRAWFTRDVWASDRQH
jgi:hypothetical protein